MSLCRIFGNHITIISESFSSLSEEGSPGSHNARLVQELIWPCPPAPPLHSGVRCEILSDNKWLESCPAHQQHVGKDKRQISTFALLQSDRQLIVIKQGKVNCEQKMEGESFPKMEESALFWTF